jgi:hypothetical protein
LPKTQLQLPILRSDFDLSGYSASVQVIFVALQRYGMMLADAGSAWYLLGAPDPRWDSDMLLELRDLSGSDFAAVDVSSLQIDPDSAATTVPEPAPGVLALVALSVLAALGRVRRF